jgi:UDP-N-acetylmuramoylalanine--D-glutamate ligase
MSRLMTQSKLDLRDPDLQGARVLVVGLGRSGLAAARLAQERGARVTITDRRPESELDDLPERARALGATVRAGGHSERLLDERDLVVVSPGVPPEIDLLAGARRIGLPIWGEVELAARFCRGRVIGVTGSNGKSTVTTMVGAILRVAGFPGGTGGNLDLPFSEMLSSDGPEAVHAVELSSFQLETSETLRCAVGLILNLSPDHLDRYASYEDYARAKARLLKLQQPTDHAVLNADDTELERFRSAVRGKLHTFSTRLELQEGAFQRAGRLVLRVEESEEDLLDVSALPQPGEHNVSNALAAALAARLVGCPPAAITRGLREYRPLPHRLQRIAEIGGVAFYDDSKATNPASATRALASFPPDSVLLILGGRDKGADWSAMPALVRRHARRVLLIGEAAGMLREQLAGTVALEDCGELSHAVERAFTAATPGDTVLLAPGCASFDQYRDFEERGDDFRRAVEALEQSEDSGA